MILNNLIRVVNATGRYRGWLLLLFACAVSGCASLPEKDTAVWPWEYGKGQGEPNTGDYTAIRAGVAKFGKPPEAVKPIKLESAESHPPGARPATETMAIKAEPTAADKQLMGKGSDRKNGYDFYVSENRSTASSLLLNTDDQAYDITAFNNGNAPVTVIIYINQDAAQNTLVDKKLPYYSVVPPKTVRNLVRVSPKTKQPGFNFSYSSVWNIGDYTATHNCPEHYQFPFGEKVRAFASVSSSEDNTPYTRNAVVFSVPKGTPVLAARKGTVVQIGSDGKVDILHEDSTIATYYHLEKITEYVAIGKTVTIDDIIGIAGTSENNKNAYMQLTVWHPMPTANDPLLASAKRISLEAVSLPLTFASAGSNKGKILSKNQSVSRGKLPAASKQTKRK